MTVTIRTDFPGGNGLALEIKELSGLVEVRFVAEPRNCPEAMWFHFRAEGLAGRALRCVLANPEQTLGGWDWSRNRPVWRRADHFGDPPATGPQALGWARCGPAEKVETPAGRVEWAWDVPPGGASAEIAHCFPYQQADLDTTLAELSASPAPGALAVAEEPAGPLASTFIGVSQKGRPMVRLYTALPDASRPAVVLTARNHAGETPGSWVLDGALRHLALRSDLRQAATWWAYPFVDLDDVVEGSYGKDPWPHDCNRSWGNGMRAETIAIIADIRRLAAASAGVFLVDLHAPAHQERTCYVPCRGWDMDSPMNPIAARFAEAFQSAVSEELRSPIAYVTPSGGGNSRHAGLTTSRWVYEILGQQGLTLEISYQGNDRRDYTIDDYRRLGAVLVETIVAWEGDKR